MLTKDLVKFRTRGTRVYPKILDTGEARCRELAEILIDTVSAHVGATVATLEAELDDIQAYDPIVKKSFVKLLLDRATLAAVDEEIAERRWQALEAAESLRTSRSWESGSAAYVAGVAEAIGMAPQDLQSSLYADLPDFQTIDDFPPLSSEALIQRFNIAQVQGLLLKASWVTVTLTRAPLATRRRFFRMIKFFQLLVSIEKNDQDCTVVRLSGPMTMFDAAQTYSFKMAQLFTALLSLDDFTLEAEVKVKNGLFRLVVDDDTPYVTEEGKKTSGYAPEQEWDEVLTRFHADNPQWEARLGDEVVNLGSEQYCLPDLILQARDGGPRIYVELFHRWHSGQFADRLRLVEQKKRDDLRLGLCRSLKKQHEELCSSSAWFATHGFFYRELPSAKTLAELLPARP